MCYIILYNELFYEKQAEPRIIPAAAACRRGTADARRERMFFNVSSYNDRMCYRRAFGSSSDSVLSFHSEKGSAVFYRCHGGGRGSVHTLVCFDLCRNSSEILRVENGGQDSEKREDRERKKPLPVFSCESIILYI